jgi:hypothetical protein
MRSKADLAVVPCDLTEHTVNLMVPVVAVTMAEDAKDAILRVLAHHFQITDADDLVTWASGMPEVLAVVEGTQHG